MAEGRTISRYQVLASFRDGIVTWRMAFETDDNKQHLLDVRDGEEIPVLVDLCRKDHTIFFDAESAEFRTGWNAVGQEQS